MVNSPKPQQETASGPLTKRTSCRWRLILAAMFVQFASGCNWWWQNEKKVEEQEDVAATLLLAGRQALAAGDAGQALDIFSQLSLFAEHTCNADYGLLLAHVLRLLESIDPFVVLLGLLSGVESLPQGASVIGNYTPIILEIVSPIEQEFASIRGPLGRVVAARCSFYLPEGFPVQLGRSGSEFYLSAVLGDEWDAAPARLMGFAVEIGQALIDLVLSHRFTLLNEDLDRTVQTLLQSLQLSGASEGDTSWLTPARAAGAVFDVNPLFLDFSFNESDRNRIFRIDNDLEAAFRFLYDRDANGVEFGFVRDLLDRTFDDNDLRDNVIGLVDNGDGRFGLDDTLIFGIHRLTIGSIVAPDTGDAGISTPPVSLYALTLNGAVEVRFEAGLGDVGEATRLLHEVIFNLRSQMTAVDRPDTPWSRLGFTEVNGIIGNLDRASARIPPLPAVFEFDFRSFFVNPVPVRSLVPYWYDHDDDVDTPDHWMIEGESAHPTTEPYVSLADDPHFPDFFIFDTLLRSNVNDAIGGAGYAVTGLTIDKDLVFPTDDIEIPLPYFAWRDPTFQGVIYVNLNQLPVSASGAPEFRLATLHTINKAVNAMLIWYVREGVGELR